VLLGIQVQAAGMDGPLQGATVTVTQARCSGDSVGVGHRVAPRKANLWYTEMYACLYPGRRASAAVVSGCTLLGHGGGLKMPPTILLVLIHANEIIDRNS
jgi:hypothetical protein